MIVFTEFLTENAELTIETTIFGSSPKIENQQSLYSLNSMLYYWAFMFYSVRMQENKDQNSSEYGLFFFIITRNNKQYMLLICIERSNKTLNPGLIEIPMIYHDIDWSSKRRQPLWEPWSWKMKTKNHHFEKFYFTLCFLVYFL